MCRYKTDDLVFAKVKGHSPLPARVISRESGSKYRVLFYGTRQEATVKEESIWNYKENKVIFASKYKNKRYKNALEIIEKMEPCENILSGDLENVEDADEQDGRIQKNPFYSKSATRQGMGEQRRQGVDEVGENTLQGVEVGEQHAAGRGADHRNPGGSKKIMMVWRGGWEHRREGVNEDGENRQQGVDGQGQQGVGEVGEHRQQGVGQVTNVPRASVNSRVDDKIKVKIQVEIEMSEEQLISVGQRLPGLLNAANVQM